MQLKAVLATNIRARCYFYEDDVTRNLSTSRLKSTSNCQWTRKEKKFKTTEENIPAIPRYITKAIGDKTYN